MRVGVATVVAVLAFSGAPAAHAATAEVLPDGTIRYAAAPGEANSVSLSVVASATVPLPSNPVTRAPTETVVRIDDPGAVIIPGRNCAAAAAKAFCATSAFDNAELYLGDGNDTLAGDSAPLRVRAYGGDGNDRLTGPIYGHYLFGDAGDDVLLGAGVLSGGDGNDLITGLDTDNELLGGPGDDRIRGGSGDDLINGGTGADDMDGWSGWNRVVYWDRSEPLFLSNDEQPNDGAAGEGDNIRWTFTQMEGGAGDDTMVSDGPYSLRVNLLGLGGDDHLIARRVSSNLFGGPGADEFDGGPESDVLVGEAGNDTVRGGGGGDVFVPRSGDGDDLYDGGDGADRLDYSSASVAVNVVLDQPGGGGLPGESDQFVSVERITGTRFDDRIVGDAGPNELEGLRGSDTLIGGGGDDKLMGYRDHQPGWADFDRSQNRLEGGDGDDVLFGYDGNEEFAGGPGNDTIWARWSGGTPSPPDLNQGTDSVGCGDGLDLVNPGTTDSIDADCEERG